jgi:hypothetical protein
MRKRGDREGERGKNEGDRGNVEMGTQGVKRGGKEGVSRVVLTLYYATDKKRTTLKSLYKIIVGRHGWQKVYRF